MDCACLVPKLYGYYVTITRSLRTGNQIDS